MTTLIALLLDRCGLSIREAAIFLNVREDTVKSWRSGRNPTPLAVVIELRGLYLKIGRAAREAIAAIDEAPAGAEIELGIAVDDHEAQALGLPCVGAHAAVLGLIAASTARPMRIVPRGSTIASAAAADAHGR
jgi:hypothetical protein